MVVRSPATTSLNRKSPKQIRSACQNLEKARAAKALKVDLIAYDETLSYRLDNSIHSDLWWRRMYIAEKFGIEYFGSYRNLFSQLCYFTEIEDVLDWSITDNYKVNVYDK